MTGNLIKDMVLMSKGIMIEEPEVIEGGLEACNGDYNACKKCEAEE